MKEGQDEIKILPSVSDAAWFAVSEFSRSDPFSILWRIAWDMLLSIVAFDGTIAGAGCKCVSASGCVCFMGVLGGYNGPGRGWNRSCTLIRQCAMVLNKHKHCSRYLQSSECQVCMDRVYESTAAIPQYRVSLSSKISELPALPGLPLDYI